MRIEPIPCLGDNYAWLLSGDDGTAAVVDPGEAAPVLARLHERGLTLRQILATHHHHDHVGGIAELCAAVPGVEVLCSTLDRERVPGATRGLADNEALRVAGEPFLAMHVPGHTRGAIAYFGAGAVFTGDTLFLAGCGRLFEGTAEELFASLARLAGLPRNTLVYCGHEYTEKNLRFAESVDKGNAAVMARRLAVEELRRGGAPSVPASLREELATNPFLRAKELAGRLGAADALAAFKELRRRRDEL